jgi:hypothetical protein
VQAGAAEQYLVTHGVGHGVHPGESGIQALAEAVAEFVPVYESAE